MDLLSVILGFVPFILMWIYSNFLCVWISHFSIWFERTKNILTDLLCCLLNKSRSFFTRNGIFSCTKKKYGIFSLSFFKLNSVIPNCNWWVLWKKYDGCYNLCCDAISLNFTISFSHLYQKHSPIILLAIKTTLLLLLLHRWHIMVAILFLRDIFVLITMMLMMPFKTKRLPNHQLLTLNKVWRPWV